ncbi:hypothetical protein MCEMAEM21_00773 [Oxalobacteraceae bacterium]
MATLGRVQIMRKVTEVNFGSVQPTKILIYILKDYTNKVERL